MVAPFVVSKSILEMLSLKSKCFAKEIYIDMIVRTGPIRFSMVLQECVFHDLHHMYLHARAFQPLTLLPKT